MEDRESILGLDNIRLELPIASGGRRTLAAMLDYLILLAFLIAWSVGLGIAAVGTGLGSTALFILGAFVLEWGYFAGSEIATGGRTLGKMALKLRVITAEGGTPGAGALLARNLVRDLDVIFGIPLMAIDPLSRRLGDRLAGTLVVHERRRTAPALLVGRVPPGWGPRELAAVESLLARADGIEDTARTFEMADRILERLRREAPELLAGSDRSDPIAAIRRALAVERG